MQATYTANLTITAQAAWATWYTFSDRACNDTAIVYRWYLQTFFSAQAQARYIWIGEMLGCLIALAILYLQQWAENQVQASRTADHVHDAGNMVEPNHFVEPNKMVQPATMASPVAVRVIPIGGATVTSAELRRQCQSAGIRWRNAHGPSRHLTKAEMISALS